MLFPVKTFTIVAVSITTNAVLWLDSFDRYLSTRYHLNLALVMPEWAFTPSRVLQEELSHEVARETGPIEAIPPAQPQTHPVPPSTSTSNHSAPSMEVAASPKALRAPEAAPQHRDAPKILFAGDSMMQGVAPIVISRLKKEYPGALLLDLSKQSTGLTVRRYFDWPTKIREETERRGIKDVVIFLGPNDPWDITENKERYVFPSQEWEDKYRQRVVEVMQHARDHHIRVVWIGLPAMKNERVRKGATIQNRIFREECSRFGFIYLETEDLFGRLSEPFNKYISDEKKGQLVVRADDGTHFTPFGLRMIADRLVPILKKQDLG